MLYGISNSRKRFSNVEGSRTAFLLNPVNSSPIVAAIKHSMPNELLRIHAFDTQINKVIEKKLNLALLSTPKTPSLKEKLYKKQDGSCYLCREIIEHESLHFNTTHIHHINPIKLGGDKFALKNLALTHSLCHREHKH